MCSRIAWSGSNSPTIPRIFFSNSGVNTLARCFRLDATLKTRPGDGSTHWSVRMLPNTSDCLYPLLGKGGT
jgi:hypothetical protein